MRVVYIYNGSLMVTLFVDVSFSYKKENVLYFSAFDGACDIYFHCESYVATAIIYKLSNYGYVDLRDYNISDLTIVYV